MNNFKKIGLSALAGSLAAFTTASAVEMSAAGSAKLTYKNGHSTEVNGNPYGMNTSISFTGCFLASGISNLLHDEKNKKIKSSNGILLKNIFIKMLLIY